MTSENKKPKKELTEAERKAALTPFDGYADHDSEEEHA
jgi:hypothetical protein